METGDLWVYELMGERGKELTGYPCLSVYHGFRYHPKEVTNGGFDDWVYDHLGIFSFTVELWDLPAKEGIKDRDFIEWFRKHPHEDDLKILKWLEKTAMNRRWWTGIRTSILNLAGLRLAATTGYTRGAIRSRHGRRRGGIEHDICSVTCRYVAQVDTSYPFA